MKQWTKRIALVLLVLLLLISIGFVAWAEMPLGPMPEALDALQSDDQVRVETHPWFTFVPAADTADSGVILYPGGRVDPRSYAPLANRIAAQGYLVIIPPMPLNLAVFAPNRAEKIIQAYPEIQTWVIGGHSLGGAMAAEYVISHSSDVDGLILWASFPAESTDLQDVPNLSVLSIYGTEDGGLDGILASRTRLPQDATWIEISGGNHAQFGWYGIQPGDGTAVISRAIQQEQILQKTLDFLGRLGISK